VVEDSLVVKQSDGMKLVINSIIIEIYNRLIAND